MPTRRGGAAMLESIADELESLGLPHEWVRCVIRGDDTIVYEDTQAELDAQQAGAWYDTWGDNGLHYPARVFDADGNFRSLTDLSPTDAAITPGSTSAPSGVRSPCRPMNRPMKRRG